MFAPITIGTSKLHICGPIQPAATERLNMIDMKFSETKLGRTIGTLGFLSIENLFNVCIGIKSDTRFVPSHGFKPLSLSNLFVTNCAYSPPPLLNFDLVFFSIGAVPDHVAIDALMIGNKAFPDVTVLTRPSGVIHGAHL